MGRKRLSGVAVLFVFCCCQKKKVPDRDRAALHLTVPPAVELKFIYMAPAGVHEADLRMSRFRGV